MKTTLYYKDGSSDKVYSCEIVEQPGGYVVNFAYGRRGANMATGTKTNKPVSREAAEKIYNKLVQEKKAKGYTPGEDGAVYTAPGAKEKFKYNVQLLNFVDEATVSYLIEDTTFCAQEKFDGERMILSIDNGVVTAGNKLGLSRAVPACLVEIIKTRSEDNITYDGELVGEVYYPFDVLVYEGKDIRDHIYFDRVSRLPVRGGCERTCFRPVETAIGTEAKRTLFERLRNEGKEGIVFKHLSAPYTAGRPASGGKQLKFKFYATASCRVAYINQKRSVMLEVLENGKWIEIGNVTIPPNKGIPSAGDVVEVRYLYAYKGGSLFQPTYLGPRNDVLFEECTVKQLKYKLEDK